MVISVGADVVLTDRKDSIAILKENVQSNTCSTHDTVTAHSDSCMQVSCGKATPSLILKSSDLCNGQMSDTVPREDNTTPDKPNSIEVQVLNWADRSNTLFDRDWDLVIGSDIIYIESSFDHLLHTMRQLKCSRILLSCRLRYAKDHKFIKRSKEFFDVDLLFHDEGRDIRIFSFETPK